MVDSENTTAILLAGGRGTRLGVITRDKPKPLIPVSGRPFIEWVALQLSQIGVRKFVVSVGYRATDFDAWRSLDVFEKPPFLPGSSVEMSVESEPLGTGGAVINALPMCGRYTIVANADSLVLGNLTSLSAGSPEQDVAICAVYSSDASRYGSLVCNEQWELTDFHEKVTGSGWINAGVYMFKTSVLQSLELRRGQQMSMERDVMPRLLAARHCVKVVPIVGAAIIDIGTPESLAGAEECVTRWSHGIKKGLAE